MSTENAAQSEAVTPFESKEIKRPWYVYLMAVWAFIGGGGFLAGMVNLLVSSVGQLYQAAALLVMGFSIVLVVNIIRMKKTFIIIFGVLCGGIVITQAFGMASGAYQGLPLASLLPMLMFLVPSAIFAALALRPNFLRLAVAFREPIERDAMLKYAMKKTRG